MPKKIVRRARARRDIDGVIDHYLSTASQAVALAFIDELNDALKVIASAPQMGSTRYDDDADLGGVRFWTLRRYPYLIFYYDLGDRLDVWRVLHASRDIAKALREPDDC